MKKAPSRSRVQKPVENQIALLDQAIDCCFHISALGKLLSVSGRQIEGGWVDAETIAHLGEIFCGEAEKLNELLLILINESQPHKIRFRV